MEIDAFERFIEYYATNNINSDFMKISVTVLVFTIWAFNTPIISQEVNDKRKMRIVIDVGHGGKDSGAVSENGLYEKDVVLSVAFQIAEWNRIISNDKYDIYLTRYNDTLISLSDRVRLTKELKPDLFISLHCNHAQNKNAKGIEAYTYSYGSKSINSKTALKSRLMALTILNAINQHLNFKSRGIKSANFQVLRDNKDVCPSILVELGFLSNQDECSYLKSDLKLKALALVIFMSIKEYSDRRIMDKNHLSHSHLLSVKTKRGLWSTNTVPE